jgi:uncharacterized protein YaiL (DUF2058 family)
MRNPLQDQLLKAGLVKKSKVAEVVREQTRQRQGKAPPPANPAASLADAAQAGRAARDRELAAERKAAAQAAETRAQIRQIIETGKLKRSGEIAYRFQDGAAIRSLLVDEAMRRQLAAGALVIVRSDDAYEIVARATADRISARDVGTIVLDHATSTTPSTGDDDAFYARFQVPDDLVW